MANGVARYRQKVAATAFAVLAALLVAGSGGLAEAREPWSKAPNTASSGNFAILQIATTDPEGLITEWSQATPGVSLKTSTQARRNQRIETFIVFKGCRADAAGNCNVTVDYAVFDPAGKSYAQLKGDVWVGYPPAPDLQLQLSTSSLGLMIEDQDPLGPYRVRAKVVDHVAGVTLDTEQTLAAVAN
jgi:hypothetical protein